MPPFLKKEIAGIPAYVWALLVLAAVGLGLYLRRRSQNSQYAPDTGIPPDESVPFPGTVGGGTGGGGVGGGGGGNPPPDYTPITDAISKLETDLASAIASIPIPSEIPSPAPQAPPPVMQLPPAPAATEPTPVAPLPQPLPPTTVQTAPPPPPPGATQPGGPIPGASFVWVFNATTFHGQPLPAHSIWYIGDKALFLNHLGARGLTYAQWKANHPAAALRVFGDR